MRRLFLILMIALLPVRGWIGDVMAMEMASKQIDATKVVANYLYPTLEKSLFDTESSVSSRAECPTHAAMTSALAADASGAVWLADAPGVVNDADGAASGHCNTCGACQICHSVALASNIALNPPDFTAFAPPSTGNTPFASALTALSQKPPIS